MAVAHRLVIVIAFFGALVMSFAESGAYGSMGAALSRDPWGLAFPGILAAIVIYPLAFMAGGFRRR